LVWLKIASQFGGDPLVPGGIADVGLQVNISQEADVRRPANDIATVRNSRAGRNLTGRWRPSAALIPHPGKPEFNVDKEIAKFYYLVSRFSEW